MEQNDSLLAEWKDLNFQGKFADAEKFYYERLFPRVIENFKDKYNEKRGNHLLISMLGFSPEPLILAYHALNPLNHKVVVTGHNEPISAILARYLQPPPEEIIVKDESFKSVYLTLEGICASGGAGNISIDITGGKKSTVAAASIFARDHGCRLIYVDFSVYIKELRKPMPMSEILNVIYDPKGFTVSSG